MTIFVKCVEIPVFLMMREIVAGRQLDERR